MELKNVKARSFEINAVSAYATMKDSNFSHKLFANIASGSFEYDRVEADFAGFNVELSAPLNGNFGDMYFVDGKATVYLKHGQVAKAENIPTTAT